ncbi:MAG: hypothetical protein NTW44_02285, partial [Nitrospirae bacterium]|nr:hypothetical protein [Nitrospirota bacterium]
MKRLVLILLLFFAGCITNDLEVMKADINQLKKNSFDIKKESSETKSAFKTEIAELKEKSAKETSDIKSEFKAELSALKEKSVKEDSLNAIREGMVSLRSEVSGISKDLQSLTGRFDENKYFIDKSLKDKSSEIDLLRSQITALETQTKEMQTKLSSKTEADATAKSKPDVKEEKKLETRETKAPEAKTPEINDPLKAYAAAYTAFKDKKYKEAREKFEAFLKAFPKDKLAGNAQFWMAEAY